MDLGRSSEIMQTYDIGELNFPSSCYHIQLNNIYVYSEKGRSHKTGKTLLVFVHTVSVCIHLVLVHTVSVCTHC